MQFANKNVLVTAGADGIGRSIASAFLGQGALVHVADISQTACDQLGTVLQGENRVITCCDVSNPEQVDELFARHRSEFAGLDVLVNCAGVKGPTGPVEAVDYPEWRRCIAVNLDSTFLCSRAAVPLLRDSRQNNGAFSPSIVSMSSTAGWHGYANRSAYAAAKWAVIGFTKSIAMEIGPAGLRANAICPGSVNGDRMDRVIADEASQTGESVDAVRDKYTRGVSMRTFIEAEDIAAMALFLASSAAGKVTGQAISVDGHLENFGD